MAKTAFTGNLVASLLLDFRQKRLPKIFLALCKAAMGHGLARLQGDSSSAENYAEQLFEI